MIDLNPSSKMSGYQQNMTDILADRTAVGLLGVIPMWSSGTPGLDTNVIPGYQIGYWFHWAIDTSSHKLG